MPDEDFAFIRLATLTRNVMAWLVERQQIQNAHLRNERIDGENKNDDPEESRADKATGSELAIIMNKKLSA